MLEEVIEELPMLYKQFIECKQYERKEKIENLLMLEKELRETYEMIMEKRLISKDAIKIKKLYTEVNKELGKEKKRIKRRLKKEDIEIAKLFGESFYEELISRRSRSSVYKLLPLLLIFSMPAFHYANKSKIERIIEKQEKIVIDYNKKALDRILDYVHDKNAEALRGIPRIVEKELKINDIVIYIDKDKDYGVLYSKHKDKYLYKLNDYYVMTFPLIVGSKENYERPGTNNTPEGVYRIEKFRRSFSDLYGSKWAPIDFPTKEQLMKGIQPPNGRILLCGTGLRERIEGIVKGVDLSYGSIVTTNYFIEIISRVRNKYERAVIIIENSERKLY